MSGRPVYVARQDDADADFATVDAHGTHFWKADRREIGSFAEVEGKIKLKSKRQI